MKLRKASGIHSAEMIAGLMILIPIVLYAMDYATVLFGGQMNESACSAACRAAALGPPTGYATTTSSTNTPQLRASTTLAKVSQAHSVINVHPTITSFEQVLAPIPSTTYGGPFLGNITVKTRCDVFPPFLLPFVSKSVTLYTQQKYPWTYNMPATFNGQTPPTLTGTSPPQDLANTIP